MFKSLLNIFSNSNNKVLQNMAKSHANDLSISIDSYIDELEKAAGRLKAAEKIAQEASNGNPAMVVQELMYGYEYRQKYEDLKNAGIKDAEAILTAWADGHKEGKAENWEEYVS